MNKENIVIIIPSFHPDEKFLKLLQDLKNANFNNILVVNDGNSGEHNNYFEIAKNKFNCNVFTNYVNLGKGRALKNAFNYLLSHQPNTIGVITVDSDGQHSIKDIEAIANILLEKENADKLIMGSRTFTAVSDIPFRSKIGNIVTSHVLSFLCGIKVSDTQTGLRGIPKKLMKIFVCVDGERFDYETNMILKTKDENISIIEVPIETIYIEDNKTSHFRPLTDSIMIYKLLFKFSIVSFLSFLVDICLFTLFTILLSDRVSFITYSIVLARTISIMVNYNLNKTKVFKPTKENKYIFPKYILLCLVQIVISTTLINMSYNIFGDNLILIKIIIDSLLFFVSFNIQNKWVFKKIK